jgi:hypothetical protein
MLTVLYAHGQRQLLNQLWRSSHRVARNVSLFPRVEKDSPNRMRISLSVPVAAWSAATVFIGHRGAFLVYQAVLAWIVLALMCAECVPKRQVGFADDDRVLICWRLGQV